MAEEKGMRPIWYFVGWFLLMIGGLLILAGIYGLFFPISNTSVLGELHLNLWWGGLMAIVGLIFIIRNKDILLH